MSRGKAWRRAKDATKNARRDGVDAIRAERRPNSDSWKAWPAEKNWKHMYFRSNKLARAKQLGFDYPRKSERQLLDEHTAVDE